MIEVKEISKYYGTTKAVDNISFQVNKGEIVGFLGPNGAGKTTTMRMLTGYLFPNQGSISIGGYDIMSQPVEAKKHIGYLPENVPLYQDMLVSDYFYFVSNIKGVGKENKKNHIDEIVHKVGLEQVKNKIISKLSKGYKQRVGIGEALIGDPDILILDEPTIGLDPNQIIEIRNLIKELGKEKTIILSSHILQEVSALCSRIIIINEGKLVAVDTKDELLNDLQAGQKIKIVVDGDFHTVKDKVLELPHIHKVELVNTQNGLNEILVSVEKDVDIRKDLSRQIFNANLNLYEQSIMALSLEDVFIKLTKESNNSVS